VDLNVVKKIVIADIRQYSAFPEEAQFIVDIGKRKPTNVFIYRLIEVN
jgi:hypothetical protein